MTRPCGTEPHLVSPRPGTRGGDWVAAGSCDNVMGAVVVIFLCLARYVVLWGDPRRVSRDSDGSHGHRGATVFVLEKGGPRTDGWGAGCRRCATAPPCSTRGHRRLSLVWRCVGFSYSRADLSIRHRNGGLPRQGCHKGGGPEDTSATIEPTPEIGTGS